MKVRTKSEVCGKPAVKRCWIKPGAVYCWNSYPKQYRLGVVTDGENKLVDLSNGKTVCVDSVSGEKFYTKVSGSFVLDD